MAPTPLKIAIAYSGLTQREIARRVGIHESQLSRYVNGLHCDDHDTREAIAQTLGQTTDSLFTTTSLGEKAA